MIFRCREMGDKYNGFEELVRYHKNDVDYRIHSRIGDSVYAIMAIHGGMIERGTMIIADLIAGDDHVYYCFEGIGQPASHLHVSSSKFDEPTALDLARQVETVITVHGASGQAKEVYLGGLDEALKDRFIQEMTKAGFSARRDPSPTRQGKRKTTICNRGRSGKGVQLELPQGFRKSLFIKPESKTQKWKPNERLYEFIEVIRKTLDYNL